MDQAGVGWIAAIIIGGLAGWFAEMFMKSGTGILVNILLGIAGAAIANGILSFFGLALTGWLGYLIAGFIGACILLAIWRMIKR
ncbi:MAG TPA: GlsB/YeaQ/YmgE family stress response membrane protein [Rhizobiaceae bacterium]|nr:GlsB/YeaQ/YmgE family stress response membrane protein [Rhizobiaceae bacterium]